MIWCFPTEPHAFRMFNSEVVQGGNTNFLIFEVCLLGKDKKSAIRLNVCYNTLQLRSGFRLGNRLSISEKISAVRKKSNHHSILGDVLFDPVECRRQVIPGSDTSWSAEMSIQVHVADTEEIGNQQPKRADCQHYNQGCCPSLCGNSKKLPTAPE